MDPAPQHPTDKRRLSSWLDNLQRESWQLELVISGFSIFLLLGGWDWIGSVEYQIVLLHQDAEVFFLLKALYVVAKIAYASLLGCLLIHVALRGLWIAAVGLRSVSGDINYEELSYQPFFLDRLRKNMGTFDGYIERLERYCSVMFSLAFLLIFCFLSMSTWALVAIGIQAAWTRIFNIEWQGTGIFGGGGFISFFVMIMGLLYMVDFVTLGWLKRNRWLSRPYYYLYRIMGWVTLAGIYRPLYHNLIDNRFGRKLAIALPFVIFFMIVAFSFERVSYDYHPGTIGDGTMWVYNNNYDDTANNPIARSWLMSLASRYPQNNYVEAFIPYIPINHNDLLLLADSTLEVAKYTGTTFRGAIDLGNRNNPDADLTALMEAFQTIHRLYLNDSLLTSVNPKFYLHPEREQPGLLYMVPTHDLPVGEHQIRMTTLMYRTDTMAYSQGYSVNFYK